MGTAKKTIPDEVFRLSNSPIFGRRGQSETNASLVKNWNAAITKRRSATTEGLVRGKINELTVVMRPLNLLDEWGALADVNRPIITKLVESQLSLYASEMEFLQLDYLRDQVRRDWSLYCTEVYFASVLESNFDRFFTRWFNSYELGHFPCGWKGKYPEGIPIVY